MFKDKLLIPLYLWKESIPPIVTSFAILSILVFCQQISRNSELVFSSVVSWKLSAQILLSLLPPIFTFTLPVAIVLGEIITLSRLAAESEWLALETSTLSYLPRLGPFFLHGVVGFVLVLALNWNVGPRSIARIKTLRYNLTLGKVVSQIQPQLFVSQFPDHLLRIKSVNRETGNWSGVLLLKRDKVSGKIQLLAANSGSLTPLDQALSAFEIKLSEGIYIDNLLSVNNHITSAFKENTLKLSTTAQEADANAAVTTAPDSISQPQLAEMGALFRGLKEAQDKSAKNELELEIYKRLANALAGIYAACAALVLSVSLRKRSARKIWLVFTGFLLLIVFYTSLTFGQNLAIKGVVTGLQGVLLGCSIPAVVLLTLYLLLASNRLSIALPSRKLFQTSSALKEATTSPNQSWSFLEVSASSSPSSPPINLGHYLVLSEFAKYFILTVAVLTATVLLFTLLDIAPSLAKNSIEPEYALGYLVNLSPQIIYYVVPFTVLIAFVATAAALSRTGQLTILLYNAAHPIRLVLPILIATLSVLILVFYISDSVLPFTNREQDYRYKKIKGKALEQVSVALERQWVANNEDTVFGYRLTQDNEQPQLNVLIFRLNNPDYYLREVIYLEKMPVGNEAAITDATISSGSFRYLIEPDGLARMNTPTLSDIPQELKNKEALYEKNYNEASKMTFRQLAEYIDQVQRTGLSATGLKVEQMQKLAFPFACLTLLFLAFPLCLLQVRRQHQSRFSAIAASITLALIFWAILSIFEAVGKRGILPIALAVWSPHALFIALAITLQFRLHRN